MKAMRSTSTDPNATSTFVKIATLSFLFLSLIFLSKLFSHSYQHHFFAFSPSTTTAVNATSVSVGPPNAIFSSNPPPIPITPSPPPLPPRIVRPPPPPLAVERTGIVDENGFMTDDFVVGEFDPAIIESVVNTSVNEGRETGDDDDQRRKIRVKLGKFGVCDESKRDYVPCLDNAEAVSRLNSTDRGEKYERHCPEKGKGLNCLVPRPKGYKLKIPWPQSRDEVKELNTLNACDLIRFGSLYSIFSS